MGIEETSLILAWPTAGRRESLLVSVAGFAENLHAYGRRYPLLVAVDSSLASLNPLLRDGIGRLSERVGMPLVVCDSGSRERFVNLLSADFDPELLRFALFTGAGEDRYGCNRNAIALASAGGMFLSTDDDVLCRPAIRDDYSRGVAFSGKPFPVESVFYRDRDTLLSRVSPVDRDVVGEHLRFLGRDGTAFPALGEFPQGGRVLLSMPGSYGDSGFARARAVLALDGKGREELMAAGYESCRLSREVVRIPGRDVVGGSMSFMSLHSGFDARGLLPPFFPMGRNEDAFFSLLLRICRQGSLSAFPGFGVFHDPPECRAFAEGSQVDYAPCLIDVMMAVAVSFAPSRAVRDPGERMRSLGESFSCVGTMGADDFAAFAHESWSAGAALYDSMLEGLLSEYRGEPLSWAEDVRAHLARVNALLADPPALFGPLGCGFSLDVAKAQFAEFGSLLIAWPDIFARSRELNAAGAGLVSLSLS
jgi:hypothetical protein